MVVELLRKERVITVTVPLFVSEFLCPVHFGGQPPNYFVLGGLVFTVMSNPYLEVRRFVFLWSLNLSDFYRISPFSVVLFVRSNLSMIDPSIQLTVRC